MKYTTLALIIAGAAIMATSFYKMNNDNTVPAHVVESFSKWTTKHGKAYESPAEHVYRLSVFHKNYLMVKSHNESNSSYTKALNKFADMTHEELRSKYLGYKPTLASRPKNYANEPTSYTVAETKDWRDLGAVNAIKDQGQCGSCWAFSTVAALEGAWYLKHNELVSLSEQQLNDCSTAYGNHGCNGGLMDFAFKYIQAGHPLTGEKDYPYHARDQRCKTAALKTLPKLATVASFTDVRSNKADFLTNLENRPLAVAVDANDWFFYDSGIFNHTECRTNLDHGVAAVAYDTTQGFVTIRNSWGTSWGEKGYIKLELVDNRTGTCGVYTSVSYPTAGEKAQ